MKTILLRRYQSGEPEVSVFNNQLKSFVGTLEKNDFKVFEMDARIQSPILRPPTCL